MGNVIAMIQQTTCKTFTSQTRFYLVFGNIMEGRGREEKGKGKGTEWKEKGKGKREKCNRKGKGREGIETDLLK